MVPSGRSSSSPISPTISSRMSSTVTSPSVPPYSLTTTAGDWWAALSSRRGRRGPGLGHDERRPAGGFDGRRAPLAGRRREVPKVDGAEEPVDRAAADEQA